MPNRFHRYLLPLFLVLSTPAWSGTPAELCIPSDQTWTPPAGLATLKRLVVVGGGAAGGADNSGNFGPAGKNEPVGGSTGGTAWGGGGAGGKGAGGGAAGTVLEQSSVPVTGPVTVKVGKAGNTAGAAGEQSCFGSSCAAGGTGGGAYNDFSATGGGQAGWGGSGGTSQKTAPTQELGSVPINSKSAPQTITVVNNSGAPSTFQPITPPSGVTISSDSCSGTTIDKGASCTFNVAVSPTSIGEFSSSVEVSTQRGKLVVPLHATGILPPEGAVLFTTVGTHSWTVPHGISSVSVVCIGGGGGGGTYNVGNYQGGGGGGALAFKNNIPITGGQVIEVVVGAGGVASPSASPTAGGTSRFGSYVIAGGGSAGTHSNWGTQVPGGTGTGDAAFAGGAGGATYGGGAGAGGGTAGYAGDGGRGGITAAGGAGVAGAPGSGAASGGYSGIYSQGASNTSGGGGGGGGLYGLGATGAAPVTNSAAGLAGSGGADGASGAAGVNGGHGGLFGAGGGGGSNTSAMGGDGAQGACRVIWGPGRAFPSTNVGYVGIETAYPSSSTTTVEVTSPVTLPITFATQDSAGVNVIVKNVGSVPANLGPLKVTGTDPTAFSTAGSSCPAALAANKQCAFTVSFNPTGPGSFSANVELPVINGSTLSIPVNGTAAAKNLTTVSTTVDFGKVTNNSTATKTVTVTNPNKWSVPFTTSLTAGTTYFSIVGNSCSGSVPPNNGTCAVTFGFNPGATTAVQSGSVDINF